MKVEKIDDLYLVGDPKVGALSVLSEDELVAFELFQIGSHAKEPIKRFFGQLGFNDDQIVKKTDAFFKRMKRDGWFRSEIPVVDSKKLQLVYFTITNECNLSCPYCYMGMNHRRHAHMVLEEVDHYLTKIRDFNPGCHICVSGGEPLTHPGFFEVLGQIEKYGFTFNLLTNGTLIDSDTASRLGHFPKLTNVQVSIDGITSKTHAITRGNSFVQTKAGISHIINQGLPFSLAPTLHEGNKHEIYDIADWALSNNGFFTPNNLRVLPRCDQHKLTLSNDTLYSQMKQLDKHLLENFSRAHIQRCKSSLENEMTENNGKDRERFICGMGQSVVDIDWNGDVFPCNLLRDEKFIIGNIKTDSFEQVFLNVLESDLLVRTYEIPQCSECVLLSTCGGGCKAGAYYSQGTFKAPDDLCDIIRKNRIDNLKQRHLASHREHNDHT